MKKYRTINTFETLGDEVPIEHDTLDEAIECALSGADQIVEMITENTPPYLKRDGDHIVIEEEYRSSSQTGCSHEVEWWNELYEDVKEIGKLPVDGYRVEGAARSVIDRAARSVIDRLVSTPNFNGEATPLQIQILNEESGEYDSPEFQAYERGEGFGDNRTIRVKFEDGPLKEAIRESGLSNNIAHSELTERGKRVIQIKKIGYGDSALSLVEYDDFTAMIYTNGDPIECESWEHGLELLRENQA